MEEPTTVSLSWSAILWLALSSSVTAAALTAGIEWMRFIFTDRRTQKREARYLALRLAILLERFALDCADLLSKNNDEPNFRPSINLPELGAFPENADWRALDAKVSAAVLSLPNELALGRMIVSGMSEVADPDFATETASEQAGKCGYRALKAARALRERYDLPPPDLGPRYWKFEEHLREAHDKYQERLNKEHTDEAFPF